MATDTILSIFVDFNDPKDEPEPLLVEQEATVSSEIGEIREEAWTDGYLTGRQERDNARHEQTLTATLLTSLHALEAKTAEAVDSAALAVADLLVDTIMAVASDEWPAKLMGRVQMVADRIKPALTVVPEFILRDESGTEQRFDDISELSHALDGGVIGEDVTIRWLRGEATISRKALLEDLRAAVIPLSAGLVNEQNARQQT
jgi:hypothetical protein